jgi:hypothetical protein
VAVQFSSIAAFEITESRSRPTLAVSATLDDGRRVPSGIPCGAEVHRRLRLAFADRSLVTDIGESPVPGFISSMCWSPTGRTAHGAT